MIENKTYKKGTVIFEEGSWELSMYDIISGKVGIFADYGKDSESLLTELEAGKYFGEMAVVEGMPRSATAVAVEDCEVAVIESKDFGDFLKNNPEKVIDVFRNLCNRLRALSDDYIDACSTAAEYFEASQSKKAVGGTLLKKIKRMIELHDECAAYINQISADENFAFSSIYHLYY